MDHDEFVKEGVATIAEGLFDESPQADEEVELAPEAAPEVAPEPVKVRNAPQSWAKETHEMWATLDPKVQDQIEQREKQMLEGLSQYQEHNKFGKTMKEVFTPYRDILQQQGIDEAKAAQYLLNAHARLISLPADQKYAYLAQIAGNYGINLGQIQQDPVVGSIAQQVQYLTQVLTAQEKKNFEALSSKTSNDVASFADAKDEKGNALHPYFDEVGDHIVQYIQIGKSLDEAYDMAVWSNPVTREKELLRVKTDAQANLRARSKVEAEAAKKASSANVRSQDTRKAPTEPLGKMDDTMREALREIKERTH